MRTNIVINDNLISEAMLLTGIRTKREVVDQALRLLVRNSKQMEALLALQGNIHWEGNLAEMREGRFLHEESPAYGARAEQHTSTVGRAGAATADDEKQ